MTTYKVLGLIVFLSVVIAMILCLMATVFLRIYTIRKIEARLRKKMLFTTPVSVVNPLFGSVVEVALYITVKYFQDKFYKKSLPHFKYYNFNNFALKQAGYDIKEAPGSEIFLCVSCILGSFWVVIGSLFLCILKKYGS